MALAAKKKEDVRAPSETVHAKMETLARFVLQMEDEEIWAFLDALFPNADDEEKEDLFGSILICQRKDDPRRPFDEFMKEIEHSGR